METLKRDISNILPNASTIKFSLSSPYPYHQTTYLSSISTIKSVKLKLEKHSLTHLHLDQSKLQIVAHASRPVGLEILSEFLELLNEVVYLVLRHPRKSVGGALEGGCSVQGAQIQGFPVALQIVCSSLVVLGERYIVAAKC